MSYQVDSKTVIVGNSAPMKEVFRYIETLKDMPDTVLITGETGTGKMLVAKALHYTGNRNGRPYLSVNCGSLPESLMESHLFGHIGGAYTDGRWPHKGFFHSCDGGTLLLDDVSALTHAAQAKLLAICGDDEMVYKVGSTKPETFDVRIIATTNCSLDDMRKDLFYRLQQTKIELPPLRERPEDIPLLVDYFLRGFEQLYGKTIQSFRGEEMERFMAAYWEGNVRELRDTLRGIVLLDKPRLPPEYGYEPAEMIGYPPNTPLAEVEKHHFMKVYEYCKGNRSRTARMLGTSVMTVQYKIKRYRIGHRDRNERQEPSHISGDADRPKSHYKSFEERKRKFLKVYEAAGQNARLTAKRLRISVPSVYTQLDSYGIPRRRYKRGKN